MIAVVAPAHSSFSATPLALAPTRGSSSVTPFALEVTTHFSLSAAQMARRSRSIFALWRRSTGRVPG